MAAADGLDPLLTELRVLDEEVAELRSTLARSERENELLRTAVQQLLLDTRPPRTMTAEQRERWAYYHMHKRAIRKEIRRETGAAGAVPWHVVKRRSDALFAREKAAAAAQAAAQAAQEQQV